MSSKLPSIACSARRSLAVFLLAFGTIHIGLTALCGWGPAEFHDPLYGEKLSQLRRRIKRAPAGTPLAVVLGSSRAMTGLNAQLLERRLNEARRRPTVVYNFAVPGGGPVTELLLLRRLLDDGIRPDTLLLEMWPCFFAEQAVPHNLIWLESHGLGLKERNWIGEYGPLADPRSVTTTSGLLAPWYRHRFALLRRFARGLMPNIHWGVMSPLFDDAGWEPIGGQHPSDDTYSHYVETEKPTVSAYLEPKPLSSATCRVINDIFAVTKEHQIRVVLTLFPEARDLRDWCSEKHRSNIMGFLEQAGRDYDLTLIDGHDWLHDEDFFDPVHVLATGADHFTDHFAGMMTGQDTRRPENVASRPINRR
jgi:hypothetical protein